MLGMKSAAWVLAAGILAGARVMPAARAAEAGLVVGRRDDSKEAQLLEAIRASDAKRVAELLKAGADAGAVIDSRGSATERAIRYGDAGVLRAMAAGGVDLKQDVDGLNGWSALEYLLMRADLPVDVVKVLLEFGPKLKEIEWMWMPPCMSRAALNNPEVMRELLAAGADANAKSKDETWSCLDFGVYQGSVGSVRALLDAGADASRKNKLNRSVWHALAVRSRADGAEEIAQLLKGKGAGSPDATDRSGWTPMGFAAYTGSAGAVRALGAAGANVNKRGPGGQTPLVQGTLTGDAATIRALLELKADPNIADSTGATALYWAISAADPRARMRWAAAEAKETKESKDESRPRREIFGWEQTDRCDPVGKIKALLDAGADPNIGVKDEWTPLALAAFIWDESKFVWGARDAAPSDRSAMMGSPDASRFYESHDPMEIIRPLIAAGAVRVRDYHMPDALDMAAQRGDVHRGAVMEAIGKVKVVEGGVPAAEKKAPSRAPF